MVLLEAVGPDDGAPGTAAARDERVRGRGVWGI
jgi:hypothetical protein